MTRARPEAAGSRTGKDYRYMKPGLEHEDGRLTVEVIYPFSNHIRFIELTGE